MSRKQKFILKRIIFSAVLSIAGIIFSAFLPAYGYIPFWLFVFAAVAVGFDVVISAFNGIVHGHMLDENFLMTIGSVAAFALGEYPEGTFILLLYQVGELFQSIAVGKSRRSISELMDIRPDFARIMLDGKLCEVDPYEVSVGDVIYVEPGEKIPLDGILLEGHTTVDSSSLTGESVPRDVFAGDSMISGCINLTSPIKVKVSKEFDQSTVAKILELAETASSKKAKTENFVTKFAKYYTPLVVIAAVLMALLPPLLFNQSAEVWILRAVSFIVISCPCALVVSVPLAFFGALGGASRAGILIKGSNYLEALAQADTFIFDKTGTLTKGNFKVTEILTAEGVKEEELMRVAALCEAHSSHPIALSIKAAFGKEITCSDDNEYELIAGKGIVCKAGGKLCLAGNRELLVSYGYEPESFSSICTQVHIADGRYLGCILISDQLKESSASALGALKKMGITSTVMLTGDREEVAKSVSKKLGLDEYYSELLPDDKVRLAEDIIANSHGKVAFVGDGINDAPVLTRADVGIAMGGLGSDAAIEAADVVIMNDDPILLPKAIKIAKKAVRISKQNITFSLIIKFSQLILSFLGITGIWMAVFADVGVLIIAILNSMRTLKK